MHTYTGETSDELRLSTQILLKMELIKATKKLLGEKKEKITLVGLATFYAGNPTPAVSRHFHFHTKLACAILVVALTSRLFILGGL
jgi:hypothetical protein